MLFRGFWESVFSITETLKKAESLSSVEALNLLSASVLLGASGFLQCFSVSRLDISVLKLRLLDNNNKFAAGFGLAEIFDGFANP